MSQDERVANVVLGGGESGKYLAWELAEQGHPVAVKFKIESAVRDLTDIAVDIAPLASSSPRKTARDLRCPKLPSKFETLLHLIPFRSR